MSDLAFNGGEGGAVHLKQRPLQCHSFVNMACINNVAVRLKAPCADGYPFGQRCLGRGADCWCSHLFSTCNSYKGLNMYKYHLFLLSRKVPLLHVSHTQINILIKSQIPFVSPGAVSTSCHHLACPTQGPCSPAGDADRAAETGGQTYQSLFNWNSYGECNTY